MTRWRKVYAVHGLTSKGWRDVRPDLWTVNPLVVGSNPTARAKFRLLGNHFMAIGFSLFDTAIGRCALAWSEAGIVSVQIPEADERRTRARMLRSFPDASEEAPPSSIEAAILAITALLNGEKTDLSGIVLDMRRVGSFNRRVYEVARTIPPGSTLTYGDIATRLGEPGAAQAVGRALGQNPFGIVVPCHRVLGTGGKSGGFSASGGVATKLRILTIEGAHHSGEPTLFDELPFQAKSKG